MSATIIQLGTDLGDKKSTSNFIEISEQIKKGAKRLKDFGTDGVISLLDEYSKALQKSNIRTIDALCQV